MERVETLEIEYVRNLNCNYERIRVAQKPETQKYQYCILERGGMRYMLPCTLRYVNEDAFLYYDISSMQNMARLFDGKVIDREWMRDFLWCIRELRLELNRFLLEEKCILWHPMHIYQDLEKKEFYFLYVPYYDSGYDMTGLLDFWVDKIDYEDDALVEFVYHVYEQYRAAGEEYMRQRLFDDFEEMERSGKEKKPKTLPLPEPTKGPVEPPAPVPEEEVIDRPIPEKKGFRHFFDGMMKKDKEEKDLYRKELLEEFRGYKPRMVAEEGVYEAYEKAKEVENSVYGKTVYLEETMEEGPTGFYKLNGEIAVKIENYPFVIGKRKEESDWILSDPSVSRVHAKVTLVHGEAWIEDENSTNGTFKNGLRLKPFESRKLEKEDEISFGKCTYIFR